ncbi:bifunctional helix-turn-helix transcriptional regulator/GNAT family N-acetyltransferase [Burkholderia multivorans]|uniref:bifunctional helix-turn-helix transcriptional regulator/GNAT family N-acetyltransferase n=1 Tax=Burkholderia multivorans TaxID=87883 RepID=UPI000CFE5931|nr:bifunctional helix-turn-helix transcriptional regulator/GNAT family N-acetyltransferase [Burkholderia multivorans]MBR7890525.1 bifunctional helix-turn-helix transcriptional regulator/GNAT family N-acetyltransferase [Burkholderia multivorans]MBR8450615.1 bifunctional helix-turn-helix transcriptional regulator/GNAT family N-acetyltransferase [Burkholderia multivorans]MBU9447631.1 bifunctional helix-turn-helix transcriptional regulator/GNAT family N-acetyltransferase [Burkholderia multivorans]M
MDLVDLPAQPRDATILELRDFSRKLVRELGFMRATLADSDWAPSAVHAVLEIGMSPGINAKDLAQILRLDKSNTSRQLARLEAAGLVERRVSSGDARTAALFLTAEGKKLRKRIDQFATDQVSNALRRLMPADQQALLRSLALYADALAQDNAARTTARKPDAPPILEGYQPGCIGDIASLHARFYAEHWGFGAFFEKRVATELAAFAATLPAEGRALWLCMDDGRAVASLAIDGDAATGIAHLRWFIVSDALRGTGIGRQLMTRAMRFVDDYPFRETYLWTFKGLDSARHLYESSGFTLDSEAEGAQWGTTVTEQRFVRQRQEQ